MANLKFNEFMKLHEAVRVKNRLDGILQEGEGCDDECVEGYMLDEDRCSTEMIELYLADELESTEQARLDAHIEKCDSCRKTIEDLRQLNEAFRKNIDNSVIGSEEPLKKDPTDGQEIEGQIAE